MVELVLVEIRATKTVLKPELADDVVDGAVVGFDAVDVV